MSQTLNRLLLGARPAKIGSTQVENGHIIVVTSSISDSFDVLDSVNAIASQKAGLSGVDLDSIFETVKNKLRAKCLVLGGDAVISCHFSERSAQSGGLVSSQVIEMWAYGTAVKLREHDA